MGSLKQVFVAPDEALNHAANHVGLTQVTRAGKTFAFQGLAPVRILLALLTERGVTAEAASFFAPFAFPGSGRTPATNHLFTHGDPRAHAPVRPGELFWFEHDGQMFWGVALVVNAAGEPVESLTLIYKDYAGTLLHWKRPVPLQAIYLTNALSMERRAIAEGEEAHGFYAGGDTLYNLMHQALESRSLKLTFEQSEQTLWTNEADALPRYAALQAPEWILARFLRTGSVASAREVARGLGDGIQPYDGQRPLPYGTWVFLNGGDFGLVVNNTPEEMPAVVLQATSQGHDYFHIAPARIQSFWIPSVRPFRFVEQAETPAYSDLNRLIGKLRVWGSLSAYDVPVLRQGYLQDAGAIRPEVLAVFRSSPLTSSEWVWYLNDLGEGLLPSATPPSPGDVLIFRMGELLNQAIYLGNEQMAYVDKRKSENFTISKPENVLGVWRPSAKRRAAGS